MTDTPTLSSRLKEGQGADRELRRLLAIEAAAREYISEVDNPVPDYVHRASLRQRLRLAILAATQKE